MSTMDVQVKLEAILSRENLIAAWSAVKANDGAAGVDGKTIDGTWVHLQKHWDGIREKLRSGTYRPGAVRAVEIPKASGGSRLLGIPTVQDRLIQQALHQVMSAAFDAQMSRHSYGFRPQRSAHDAVTAARGYVAEGKVWVVDIDLKSFFDQVSHDRLMHLLGRRIEDKRVLALIGRYLRAPMQHPGGRLEPRSCGTPQGGPLSPLLANLYLDPLDQELERRGVAFVRYADDIALFAASERAAQRMLGSVTAWLSTHLSLVINEQKSGVSRSGTSKLLGFCIHESGEVGPAPSALKKLKERVRQLWDARQSVTTEQLRTNWLRYIQGWWNYFAYANKRTKLRRLSGWIRRHMRKCFWLRWHNRRGRYRALFRLGVRGRALGVAGCRRGAWAMAINVVVNTALRTETLNQYGFIIPWELAG
ncbi:MAG: group II intron reverse transcriptase/maturase [Rhodocyclaceae bacterium]|nr:group II intron reverse transcriptase/maturase [Rhodocyclaceae bacterium]